MHVLILYCHKISISLYINLRKIQQSYLSLIRNDRYQQENRNGRWSILFFLSVPFAIGDGSYSQSLMNDTKVHKLFDKDFLSVVTVESIFSIGFPSLTDSRCSRLWSAHGKYCRRATRFTKKKDENRWVNEAREKC